jgi:hypothetical protein
MLFLMKKFILINYEYKTRLKKIHSGNVSLSLTVDIKYWIISQE